MLTGISGGARVLPCALRSIVTVTSAVLPGNGALHTLTTQQPQPPAPVLVVQDRSQTPLQTEEALRLAQTYAGKHPHGMTLLVETTTHIYAKYI
jgi:hypothetical protein